MTDDSLVWNLCIRLRRRDCTLEEVQLLYLSPSIDFGKIYAWWSAAYLMLSRIVSLTFL